MNIREQLEKKEYQILSPHAAFSSQSRGRKSVDELCTVRTVYQHDRDRILHCKAFRRLKHKTQVFFSPEGDHYRTRLTHTLEVSQVARTVARALSLNEDLTEAIALGHDLGHTPFGHAGEKVLQELVPGGFRHVEQSLRVVDVLEKDGQGLNLTREVCDGILMHSKGRGPLLSPDSHSSAKTLEGQIVRLADIIAYVNHDLDDAVRGGLIDECEIPESVVSVVGVSHSGRIGRMVRDLIKHSLATDEAAISLSDEMDEAICDLRNWLFTRVYQVDHVHADFVKASRLLRELYLYYQENEEALLLHGGRRLAGDSLETSIADFIAGMTDRFALALYHQIFLPQPWRSQ
ncbi:MAG TPA: deoxyguanosinetriphosphate triphosphohydrolase [Geopsychrobacteraceae bacterium]|nr:deoxyguanosinetriphosphate triphosphohydrolase [Geopsychrobacteraceae bacterium]